MKVSLEEKVLWAIPSDQFIRAEDLHAKLLDHGIDCKLPTIRVYCSKLCNQGLLENSWGKGYRRLDPS